MFGIRAIPKKLGGYAILANAPTLNWWYDGQSWVNKPGFTFYFFTLEQAIAHAKSEASELEPDYFIIVVEKPV